MNTASIDPASSPAVFAGLMGLPRMSRRATRPAPKARLDAMDGDGMGIGVALWRARLDGDAAAAPLIAAHVSQDEAFASAVEVLVGMVLLLSVNLDEKVDDVASRFVASRPLDPRVRRLVCEIAESVRDDPRGRSFVVDRVPVEVVVDACAHVAEFIEAEIGASVEQQVASHMDHLSRV